MMLSATTVRTVATLATLASGAVGQTAYSWSPPFMERSEGRGASPTLGAFPDMRWQTVDGDHLGKTRLLKELALRLDDRSYSLAMGMGRRFARVSIDLARGDHASFGADFRANQKSPPARVFSMAVDWPTFIGSPLLRPASWGGLSDDYRFPFARSWATDGKDAIVSDFKFEGGVLANRAPWSESIFRGYYFDSYGPVLKSIPGTYRSMPPVRLHNNSQGVTARCNDSAFGTVHSGSYSRLFATTYGPAYANAAWHNKLVLFSMSRYTAPQAPVVHVWCLGKDPIGVDVGTGCNRVHIHGPGLSFTYTAQPLSADPTALSMSPYTVVPWFGALSNARLTVQAGWADSVTGRLSLTQASEVEIPASVPSGEVPKRRMLMQHGSTVTGPSGAYPYNPALRYGH